jgi:hypothetical protein
MRTASLYGRVPSVDSIVSGLRWLDKVGDPRTLAREARAIMQTMKPSAALDALDALLQTHGVEEAAQHPGAMHPGITFRYLNTGDTYTPTIVRYNGHYYVTSWGDVVESLERRGKRFD